MFNSQIEWLENKLNEMNKKIMMENDEEMKHTLKDERNIIVSIISGYKRARNDSTTLSWVESPDRMGS